MMQRLLLLAALPLASSFGTCGPSMQPTATNLFMVSKKQQQENGAETLSSLTNNMLRAHQEMQKDLKALEAAQAKDRGVAQAGPDGIFRIVSKEQYL